MVGGGDISSPFFSRFNFVITFNPKRKQVEDFGDFKQGIILCYVISLLYSPFVRYSIEDCCTEG